MDNWTPFEAALHAVQNGGIAAVAQSTLFLTVPALAPFNLMTASKGISELTWHCALVQPMLLAVGES